MADVEAAEVESSTSTLQLACAGAAGTADPVRLQALGLPANYVMMSCILCNCTSLDPCPFESKDVAAWKGLKPWHQVSRNKPSGRFDRTGLW